MASIIAIFPGSFKPPHLGHFKVIDKLSKNKNIKRINIIISQKPRPLNEKYLDLHKKSSEEIKKISIELKIKYKTKIEAIKEIKKRICRTLKCITDDQSLQIWKVYLDLIPIKNRGKIHLVISNDFSPIMTTMNIIRRGSKNNRYLLIKSDKDEGNKRFNDMKKKYGKKITEEVIKNFKNLNSRNMREVILNKNKADLDLFLPKKVSRERIYRILKMN